MILIMLGLVIIIIGLLDFKHGFMLYMLYQIFGYASAELFYSPGLPTITIGLLMSTSYTLLYVIKGRKHITVKTEFPYKIPFILISISLIASCFTSLAGFASEITRAVNMILHDIVTIWIAWSVIETEKDFKFLFKGYTFVFLAGGLWGIVEYSMKNNPYVLYKASLNHNGIILYDPNYNRGYRLTSLFEHPIGCGMTMAMFIVLVLVLFVKYNYKPKYKYISIVAALICIPCILFTKMRSGVFFLGIAIFSFVDFKKKKFIGIVIILILGIVAAWPLISPNLNVVLSIFNKTAQAQMKGSNFAMRLKQFDAVYHIFQMSPITGLGEKFDDYLINQWTMQAYEYESVWLDQMARHGAFGVLSNIVLMIYTVVVVPRKFKNREIFLIGLAYWVTYTMTSIPSFRGSLFYITMFYCIKYSGVYLNTEGKDTIMNGLRLKIRRSRVRKV